MSRHKKGRTEALPVLFDNWILVISWAAFRNAEVQDRLSSLGWFQTNREQIQCKKESMWTPPTFIMLASWYQAHPKGSVYTYPRVTFTGRTNVVKRQMNHWFPRALWQLNIVASLQRFSFKIEIDYEECTPTQNQDTGGPLTHFGPPILSRENTSCAVYMWKLSLTIVQTMAR